MLRITQQISSSAAKSYYSTADYYTEGQELAGVWRGKGAERLGLSGDIDQKDWDALCDNTDPRTGDQLTARRNGVRRVGWDFNFSVPKSVSLVYALTKDQRILDAFTDAVDATMATIESELQTRVRVKGQNADRTTGNCVYGRFVHLTSRPVDQIPDPHLHAHCFVFNSTYDDSENKWKAAQIASIKRDGNYFNALMHGRLASRLVELGLPVERTAKGWRIAGLDDATESKFSRRTQLIDATAERLGITDPDEKAALGALTRDRKAKHLTFDALRTVWRSWLTPDESAAVRSIERGMDRPVAPVLDPAIGKDAIEYAAEHQFERESVVPERTILTTALHYAVGRSSPEQVINALGEAGLIRGEDKGRPMVTSSDVLDEERRMIRFARDGRNACDALVSNQDNDAPEWFNSDQKLALEHLRSSRDRVMVLRGTAGSGKTSLLSTAKRQIESNGHRIFAFAPSAEASRGVLRDSGFADAETVAYLLASLDAQTAIENQVILIDEAGLVGSRTMAKVFDLAERTNARLILSGDRYQHRAVERGSALRLLEEEAGIKSAQLTEIVRQKDRYKQAVAYLSQGRVEAGFKTLDGLNWVHEITDALTRYDRIAAEYLQATEAKKSVLIVSPTHSESDKVTRAVRSTLQREGKIGPNKSTALKLTNRNLTVAQRRDRVNYADGDVIVFTQNAKGFKKGTRLIVGVDSVPLDLAERFSVYHAGRLELAEGDAIRITGNSKSACGHALRNGQACTIDRIAADGTLILNDGRYVGPQHGLIDYNYCGTSHSSQGKTKDVTILAESAESFPAASREQLYVSVSRGRTRCSIYTDDKTGLLEAVSGSGDRISATELMANQRSMSPIRRLAIHQSLPPHVIHEPVRDNHGVHREY